MPQMIVGQKNVVGKYPGENVKRGMPREELSGGDVRNPMQDYKSLRIAVDLCIHG